MGIHSLWGHQMAKKKPTGGEHKTPRKAVQLPEEWYDVARRRAGERAQPVMWYLIGLIEADAKSAGEKDIPAPPWQAS